MERFGKEAVQEAQRSVSTLAAGASGNGNGISSFKMNRRRNKMFRKKGQKTIVVGGAAEGDDKRRNRSGDVHPGKRGRSFSNKGGGGGGGKP